MKKALTKSKRPAAAKTAVSPARTLTPAEDLYQVENLLPPARVKMLGLARVFGLTLEEFVRQYRQRKLPGQPQFKDFKLQMKIPKVTLVVDGPVPPPLAAVFRYYGGMQEWNRSQFRGGVECDLADHLYHPTTGEILKGRATIWQWFADGQDARYAKVREQAAEEKRQRHMIEVDPAARQTFTITLDDAAATYLQGLQAEFPNLSPERMLAGAANMLFSVLVDGSPFDRETFAAVTEEKAPVQIAAPPEQSREARWATALLETFATAADADQATKRRCRELAGRLITDPTKGRRSGMLQPLVLALGAISEGLPDAQSDAQEIAAIIAVEAPADLALNASAIPARRKGRAGRKVGKVVRK